MRTLQRLAASTLTAACLALPISARADEQTGRHAGDVLSFALPAATLGVELWRGDRAGSLQFAESLAVTLAATEVLKRSIGARSQGFRGGHLCASPSRHRERLATLRRGAVRRPHAGAG